MNDIARVIAKLEQQRENIDRAITALKSLPQSDGPATPATAAEAAPKKKRRLSAAGRAKIAAAVRKYWAEKKAAAAKKK